MRVLLRVIVLFFLDLFVLGVELDSEEEVVAEVVVVVAVAAVVAGGCCTSTRVGERGGWRDFSLVPDWNLGAGVGA